MLLSKKKKKVGKRSRIKVCSTKQKHLPQALRYWQQISKDPSYTLGMGSAEL